MQTRTLKVGMGQMLVEGGRVHENLKRAEVMIARGAGEGCDVVVLPECMDCGWGHPSARELAQPIPGWVADRLQQAARAYKISVVAGVTERADDQLYNAALLVSSEGEILLRHRKINELEVGQELYSVGNSLAVASTPLGIVGINICADLFPESLALAESLARMGAQIILSPCAWAMPATHDNKVEPYGALWRTSYATVASKWSLPVVGVSNVGWLTGGAWSGRKCIGCSLAVGPDGKVLAQGPYGEAAEALLVVRVPLRLSSSGM